MRNMETFANWLLAELKQREWTQADLATRAKVSKTAISDILSGRRNVGTELATAIADALKVPQEDVYIAAGILRPKKDRSAVVEQILYEIEDRSPDEQREFLSYIRFINNQRKRK